MADLWQISRVALQIYEADLTANEERDICGADSQSVDLRNETADQSAAIFVFAV